MEVLLGFKHLVKIALCIFTLIENRDETETKSIGYVQG